MYPKTCTHIHLQREIYSNREGLFSFYFSQLKEINCRAVHRSEIFLYLVSLADTFLYILHVCMLSSSALSPCFSVMLIKVQESSHQLSYNPRDASWRHNFIPQGDYLHWRVLYASLIWWYSCKLLFLAFIFVCIISFSLDLAGLLHVFFYRVTSSF